MIFTITEAEFDFHHSYNNTYADLEEFQIILKAGKNKPTLFTALFLGGSTGSNSSRMSKRMASMTHGIIIVTQFPGENSTLSCYVISRKMFHLIDFLL